MPAEYSTAPSPACRTISVQIIIVKYNHTQSTTNSLMQYPFYTVQAFNKSTGCIDCTLYFIMKSAVHKVQVNITQSEHKRC